MNKEDLCKHKHIYYVHTDSNGNNHIEKYPVIYINSEYVYFKKARKNELGKTYTSWVKKDLKSVFEKDYKFLWDRDRYFWINNENAESIITAAKARFDEDRNNRWKIQAKNELDRARKNYEYALRNYKTYDENYVEE